MAEQTTMKKPGWGTIVNDLVNTLTGGSVKKIQKKQRQDKKAGQGQTSSLYNRAKRTLRG